MANVLVDETALQDIADAIRTKNGTQNTYKPGQMADAIEAIPSGGITPTGTVNINSNGTHDVTQYASASVNVPNSYAASDEGKVVSNGALVAQGSDTVTQNGTVDTTLISSLAVNVPSTTPTGTKQISITQNGTTTEDVTNYASAEISVNVPSSGTTMYTGEYTPSTMPTANVPFAAPGATNFLIRVANTATIDMTTGHAFFCLVYADTSKTSQFGSNNGGTTISNGNDRYATGARSGSAPGVMFTSDGVELIFYDSTSYRWFQAGLTYNWYAW